MGVKITDNSDLAKFKVESDVMIINRLIIEDIHSRSSTITPMKTGNLRLKVDKTTDGKQSIIRWLSPYSARQENVHFKHYTTPGTGPHFARDSVKDTMNNLNEQIRKVW